MNRVFLLLFLVCSTFALGKRSLSIIAERNSLPIGWVYGRVPLPSEDVYFQIYLHQRNLDVLDQKFWEVSDPNHANYGQYLTVQELRSLIAADPASFTRVLEWLSSSGIPASSVNAMHDHIQVKTTVDKASDLFSSQFYVYSSTQTGHSRTRIAGAAYIPTDLKEHIHFIGGLSELFHNHITSEYSLSELSSTDQPITPLVLQSYYGIPTIPANNTNNLQGVAAFGDYFSIGALNFFTSHFYGNTITVNITASGTNCLNTGCDSFESDLDVEYITGIGKGVPTFFINYNGASQWVLDWSQGLLNSNFIPYVNSISYGAILLTKISLGTHTNNILLDQIPISRLWER